MPCVRWEMNFQNDAITLVCMWACRMSGALWATWLAVVLLQICCRSQSMLS